MQCCIGKSNIKPRYTVKWVQDDILLQSLHRYKIATARYDARCRLPATQQVGKKSQMRTTELASCPMFSDQHNSSWESLHKTVSCNGKICKQINKHLQ